jgi:hypothetical protein
MTFQEFIREKSNRMSDPLAALVALTDVEMSALPPDERAVLLDLVREHALTALALATEIWTSTYIAPTEIDLRDPSPQAAA